MEKKATQACEACRLRKVKCNGQQPCTQCSHLNVACTFRANIGRRNVPVRGRLISQLRSEQTAKISNKRRLMTPAAGGNGQESSLTSVEEPISTSAVPLECIYFIDLIPSYEKFAYPVNPIVTSAEILESIQLMHEHPSHAAFVYAFAAATVNLTEVSSGTMHGDVVGRIHDLGARSLAAKHRAQRPGSVDSPPRTVCVRGIMTCIFLEICAMACKQYERAFQLLQKAITDIHTLQMKNREQQSPDEHDNDNTQRPEVARQQRMYWEAFVHERFLTVVSGYPLTMQPLRTGLPYADPTIPTHIHEGFIRIIRLFSILDDEFLLYWTSQDLPEEERPLMTAEYVERKQTQLDDNEAEMAAAGNDCDQRGDGENNLLVLTGLQRADLFVTRMWQRVLVWQLGMSRCLLSSVPPASSHEAMSLVSLQGDWVPNYARSWLSSTPLPRLACMAVACFRSYLKLPTLSRMSWPWFQTPQAARLLMTLSSWSVSFCLLIV